MSKVQFSSLIAATAAIALIAAGCGSGAGDKANSGATGSITMDGSSTVYPFAQAAAELYREDAPNVKVTVGESGTGGGFEKFCVGEIHVADASRPIKDEEKKACAKNGIEFTEVKVALDGIAVTTNPGLKVQCLTTKELNEVWKPRSKVATLSAVNPKLPATQLSLFGPGTDSGTFDYFTEVINGEEGASRTDYQPSEDDNVLVEGVAGDPGGLGYFGYSYYEQNVDKLNLVAVDDGDGCIKPSAATIQDGTYKPLSRPLMMYISNAALKNGPTREFIKFLLDNSAEIAKTALMVPLSDQQISESKSAFGS